MQASEDPSFAGPFAYYSNVPMKVFAGNLASPPTAVLIEALNRIQSGGAKGENLMGVGKALEMDCGACESACNAGFNTCLGPDNRIIDEISYGRHMDCQSAHQSCNLVCAGTTP